jgi:hypothetical protein
MLTDHEIEQCEETLEKTYSEKFPSFDLVTASYVESQNGFLVVGCNIDVIASEMFGEPVLNTKTLNFVEIE